MKQKIAEVIRKDVEYVLHDISDLRIKYNERGALQAAEEIVALLEPNNDTIRRAAQTAHAARLDYLNRANDMRKEVLEEAEFIGLKAALEEIKCCA
jgi:hypothetical protein